MVNLVAEGLSNPQIGQRLCVLFALGVVSLAGAMTRLAGWVTLLASAVILTLSLIDAAFTISAAEAVTHGHAATASVGFDLIDGPGNDAVGRVFLIAPPLLLPLGAVLLGSQLLPRAFGSTAVAFGVASIILGLAALFSATAFSLAIILIIAESASGPRRRGRPGDFTETGIRRGRGPPAAASGHRLAHQRLPAAVKEPAMHPLISHAWPFQATGERASAHRSARERLQARRRHAGSSSTTGMVRWPARCWYTW